MMMQRKLILPATLMAALMMVGGLSGGAVSEPMKVDPTAPLSPVPRAPSACTGEVDSPAVGVLVGEAFEDVYCVEAAAGSVISVHVDTNAAATTHDPWAAICTSPNYAGCSFFDDEVACTYPPPSYACPRGSRVAPSTGTYHIHVGSWGAWSAAQPGPYSHAVSVTVNGAAATMAIYDLGRPEMGP